MKYFKASVLSVIIHVAICGLIVYTAFRSCPFKQSGETVENQPGNNDLPEEVTLLSTEPNPPQPAPSQPEPRPPQPEPEPPRPVLPDPEPEPIPQPSTKTEPPKPPAPKPPAPKTPVQIGPRVVRKQPGAQPTGATNKPPSQEQIEKQIIGAIQNQPKPTGNPPGDTPPLPQAVIDTNISLIRKALYNAWNQPPREAAGHSPAEIVFSIGPGGRILNPKITTSSGSTVFDQSVLDAARRVGSIPGLSAEFIKQKGQNLVIEFRLSD